MAPEETFGQLLGLGKGWRVVGARLESSMFVLKVEEWACFEKTDREKGVFC